MIEIKLNWEHIQNRLHACRYMADSENEEEAKRMLLAFAKDIQLKIKRQS